MKNLKLNALASENLSKVEMNHVKGGGALCGCSCYYAGSGGSSFNDNGVANCKGGLFSVKGHCDIFTKCDQLSIMPEMVQQNFETYALVQH